MSNIFITGANRGLGLQFVEYYLADPNNRVYASCRHPEEAHDLLQLVDNIDHVQIFSLDITDTNQVKVLAEQLHHVAIDKLICNAGIFSSSPEEPQDFFSVTLENITKTIHTNAIANFDVLRALLPHLRRGKDKTVAVVTSKMGSVSSNTLGGYYAYRASKAALNALMHSAACDLEKEGFKIMLLHPGWARTEMGGEHALVDPQDSVEGMCYIIDKEAKLWHGRFVDYQRREIAW